MYMKHYSAAFRVALVQELLQGGKSVAEIAFEYGVSAKRIVKWQEHMDLDNIDFSQTGDDNGIQKANNQ